MELDILALSLEHSVLKNNGHDVTLVDFPHFLMEDNQIFDSKIPL
jgi:hypothetical protein